MGKLPAIQLQRVQYAEKLVKDGKIVNVDDFIVAIETDNITALTDEQLNLLKAGDVVIKHTGEQDHAYSVSYKENGQGICLTYADASCVETVSYDFVEGSWVYNSTDISIIEDRQAKLTTSSVNDGTLDKAVGFDSQGNLVKGSVSGGIDIVEINAISGTLSDADYAKLGPNCIIKYVISTTNEYLTFVRDTGNQISYSSINYGGKFSSSDRLLFNEVNINKNNKSFSVINDASYFLKASNPSINDATITNVIGLSNNEICKESASHFRIPTGGTTGQVLSKVDGTDYNIAWTTPSGGGGTGHTLTFNSPGGGTVIYADGTSQVYAGIPQGSIINNAVAFLGSDITNVSGYSASVTVTNGNSTFNGIILLTDVTISQSGGSPD